MGQLETRRLRDLIANLENRAEFESGWLLAILYEIVSDFVRTNIENEKICFPIPIRHLVRSQNIDIVETDLNPGEGSGINYAKGRLSHIYGANNPNNEWTIYVDKYQSDDSMRYMLAHEISHFLFRNYSVEIKKGANLDNCVDPLFPRHFEEQCADIMAAFILFPITEVVKTLDNYAEQLKRTPDKRMDVFDWLQQLSYEAQVPFHYTAICYQHIRYLMSFYYRVKLEKDKCLASKQLNEMLFGENSFYSSFDRDYEEKYINFFG